MFTGIIEEVGFVDNIKSKDKGTVLTISANKVLDNTKIGDSIAVNGVCLTVVDIKDGLFSVDVSFETISKSNIGKLRNKDALNLEKALKLSDRLDGHIVLGHVDAVGKIGNIREVGEFYVLSVFINDYIFEHCVDKGSVAIDGISLTISKLERTYLEVAIIPHTFNNTNLKYKRSGEYINIEVDILGKYIGKMIKKDKIDELFLAKHGFV